MLPSKNQYQKWSLPSKYTYWGLILAVIGVGLSIYFGLFTQKDKRLSYNQIELLTSMVLSQVLEGSEMCCEIKTAEIVFIMPEELKLIVNASDFIGRIPDSLRNSNDFTFSYSMNAADTLKLFDCRMIGKHDINIFFLKNQKVLCSKPAIIELRDPFDICGAKK